MALTSGTRLVPYEINAQIGVGGMGEVCRATDTNLKRNVAIKAIASDRARSLSMRHSSLAVRSPKR
jgi:serine/threonine protein kinase